MDVLKDVISGLLVRVRQKPNVIKYIRKYWFVYLLVFPGFLATSVFHYIPLYGIIIAFKDYRLDLGIMGSPWVGLKHFSVLFQDEYFFKVVWNTVLINIYGIFFGFTFVIFLALMLNEIKNLLIKRAIQTFVYLPNFLSWVVFGGLITLMLSPSEGPINYMMAQFGMEKIHFLVQKDLFRWVVVFSGIFKSAGFGTIIYLASMAGINPELYESSIVDGANRFHMMWHITLPRIKPTIAVLLILNVANLFSSNFEQIYTLYNPQVRETGDVLSTYLYRTGLLEGQFEKSTALGLVFSLIGLVSIFFTNKFINKMNVIGIF